MQQVVIDDSVALNRNVPIPLYYQLKQYIKGRIQNGIWERGAAIPTEQQFCETFAISRPTVRQAINELIAEGYLSKWNRKVTVASPKLNSSFFDVVQSFNKEMRNQNIAPETRVIFLGEKNNKEAAEKLSMPDSRCVCLKRLRLVNKEPVVSIETYLPYSTMSDLLSLDFTDISLYEILEERYKVEIKRVDRVFEAILSGPSDAENLGVKKGSPICFVKTVAYDQYDVPFEYSLARYRGDKNQFHMSIAL